MKRLPAICAMFVIVGCQQQSLTTLSDSEIIQLQRYPCYGNCPSYVVTIHGDGRVEYVGLDNVKLKGKHEGLISRDAIKAILAKMQ